MQRSMQRSTLAGIAAIVVGGAAHASILPAFNSTSPAGSNTAFDYTIVFGTAQLPNGQPVERLDTGDFVTIYDIPGFVSATAPAQFSVSVQNLGVDGISTLPADDPLLPNVTFRYTGATLLADTNFPNAVIVSNFGNTATDNYTGETTNNVPPLAGNPIGHIGLTTVPAIPEPGAMISVGALAGLTLLRRRA